MRLIDADAIDTDTPLKNAYDFWIDTREDLRARINKVPTIDAEPVRHGHWEDVGRVYGHEDLFCGVCSECGKITVAFELMPERCSHCGAKMHEEDSKNV